MVADILRKSIDYNFGYGRISLRKVVIVGEHAISQRCQILDIWVCASIINTDAFRGPYAFDLS